MSLTHMVDSVQTSFDTILLGIWLRGTNRMVGYDLGWVSHMMDSFWSKGEAQGTSGRYHSYRRVYLYGESYPYAGFYAV